MNGTEDLSGAHAWVVLSKAHRAVALNARKQVDSLGLGMSDFAVLEVLLHKGPLPVNVIGAKVLLTSGSVTTAIDRLEAKGLVERAAHGSDRRARIVHLTARGRELIECAFAEHRRAMDQVFRHLTAQERATLERLLKKLGLHAEELLTV